MFVVACPWRMSLASEHESSVQPLTDSTRSGPPWKRRLTLTTVLGGGDEGGGSEGGGSEGGGGEGIGEGDDGAVWHVQDRPDESATGAPNSRRPVHTHSRLGPHEGPSASHAAPDRRLRR